MNLSLNGPIGDFDHSVCRQYMFEFKRAVAEKEDEEAMYHFISYMPIRGRLYEFDGCNPGPIDTILMNRSLALADSDTVAYLL